MRETEKDSRREKEVRKERKRVSEMNVKCGRRQEEKERDYEQGRSVKQ